MGAMCNPCDPRHTLNIHTHWRRKGWPVGSTRRACSPCAAAVRSALAPNALECGSLEKQGSKFILCSCIYIEHMRRSYNKSAENTCVALIKECMILILVCMSLAVEKAKR